MSFFDDPPAEDEVVPETPLDETTPPMDLIERADKEGEATAPDDRAGDEGESN